MRFGDPGWRIGYARDAVNSYFVFKTLREKGALAKHLRFQVSLASVNSALPPRIFPNHADIAKIRPGFTEALAAEADMIGRKIPHDDLAIQWDCSTEVQDVYGAVPGFSADGAIERNVAQFRTLSARIPEAVQLGYHFCFGTLGGWPRFAPGRPLRDRRARERHRRGLRPPRRLDPHSGAAGCRRGFLRAAEEPQAAGARVYLGVVHHMDGFKERIAHARKYPAGLRRRRLLRLRPRAARQNCPAC